MDERREWAIVLRRLRNRLDQLGDDCTAQTGLRPVSYPAFCHWGTAIWYLEQATEQMDHAIAALAADERTAGE
jgi:hypothetical protein